MNRACSYCVDRHHDRCRGRRRADTKHYNQYTTTLICECASQGHPMYHGDK